MPVWRFVGAARSREYSEAQGACFCPYPGTTRATGRARVLRSTRAEFVVLV